MNWTKLLSMANIPEPPGREQIIENLRNKPKRPKRKKRRASASLKEHELRGGLTRTPRFFCNSKAPGEVAVIGGFFVAMLWPATKRG